MLSFALLPKLLISFQFLLCHLSTQKGALCMNFSHSLITLSLKAQRVCFCAVENDYNNGTTDPKRVTKMTQLYK